jgi:hypothetical protein
MIMTQSVSQESADMFKHEQFQPFMFEALLNCWLRHCQTTIRGTAPLQDQLQVHHCEKNLGWLKIYQFWPIFLVDSSASLFLGAPLKIVDLLTILNRILNYITLSNIDMWAYQCKKNQLVYNIELRPLNLLSLKCQLKQHSDWVLLFWQCITYILRRRMSCPRVANAIVESFLRLG